MQHLQAAAPQIDLIAVLQHPVRRALKYRIRLRTKIPGQGITVRNHRPDLRKRQRERTVQPFLLRLVHIKTREAGVSSNVVPMRVRRHGNNRPVRQIPDQAVEVANSQAGVDEQTARAAVEQITMGMLPMAVLTQNVCIPIQALCSKPITHALPPLPAGRKHLPAGPAPL